MDVNLDGGFSKPFASCNCSNNKESESGGFECNICFDTSQDPVVTLCGHLYCWPCLYQWLQVNFYSQECPVCKAIIEEEKLVPIYGRGKGNSDNIPRLCCNFNLPKRPIGQRPPTAPPVQIHIPTGGTRSDWFGQSLGFSWFNFSHFWLTREWYYA